MSSIVNADEFGELTFQYFRYFLTLYEERSFVKAARRLDMSQPALSTAIMRFEQELGQRLFIRDTHTRETLPTEVATAIKPYVEAALAGKAKVQQLAAQFAGEELAGQL
jgi:DNA-binding transcriptional LysR family regulator